MKRINFGLLRSFLGFFSNLFSKTKTYSGPELHDPYHRTRTRLGTKRNRAAKKRRPLPCEPGTIVYQDWLVRELGYDRRLAEGYLYAFRNGYKIKMPMPGDFSASK